MGPGREVGGYVLAGGRSSRMGREKALLALGGKPLIEQAVTKLRRVCGEVAILSSNPALAEYAPLVPDVRPGCGPLGGMEAGLLHTGCAWNLFLPVDVPFLPAALLRAWVASLPETEAMGARVYLVKVDGVAQPTVALIHRDVRPYLTGSLERGQYKLLPALERAAAELGRRDPGVLGIRWWNVSSSAEFHTTTTGLSRAAEDSESLTKVQRRASKFWFANLNTPEEFSEAELNVEALDV